MSPFLAGGEKLREHKCKAVGKMKSLYMYLSRNKKSSYRQGKKDLDKEKLGLSREALYFLFENDINVKRDWGGWQAEGKERETNSCSSPLLIPMGL